jgi:hypothetical protein
MMFQFVNTLSFFANLAEPAFILDGEWRIFGAHQGHGFELGYADPNFDDSPWKAVSLPHLRHSSVDQDTLWYRHHFTVETPPAEKRLLLRAVFITPGSGSMAFGRRGYFQPFGFDITGLIARR